MPTGALAFSSAQFGAGAGPIFLDNVACSGSENNLLDCPHSSFISCYSNGNAGVRCQGRVMVTYSTLVRSSLTRWHCHDACLLQSIQVAIVHMETFVWWEAPISMRVEWKCASITSGGQCVMTTGTALMLLWSANNWDMLILEVSTI